MKLPTNILTQLPKDKYLVDILPRLKEAKTKSFITLVMTLISIAGFSIFAINPTISTIVQLNKQLDDSKFIVTKLNQKIENLSKLQQNYTIIQNDLPILLSAIPSSPNIPFFVGQIQSIAKKSNMNLVRVQTLPIEIPQGTMSTESYLSFAFNIDATGQPGDINNFISALNGFDRLITIDSFSISQTVISSTNVRINLKGRSFFKTI
jgi:Tfp pilus assembly protein PilO